MKIRIILSIFALFAMQTAALAQTNPNLSFGQVLTPAQWSNLFAQKQDTLGFTPLNTAGGIMTGRLVTAAPGATTSGFNLGCGSTPASPVNGDQWCTSAGLFIQINGGTVGPLTAGSSSSFAGTAPIAVSFPSGVVTYAFNFSVANTFLAQQTDQGATTTQPGWYTQLTGDTFARVRVGLNSTDVASLALGSGGAARDLLLERAGPATLRLGSPDAAAAIAQTVGVQNVVAGTSNTAGANLTINGSQGTGTGIGGSILLQVAPAGSAGSTQNALSPALTLSGAKLATFGGHVAIEGVTSTGATGTQQLVFSNSPTLTTPALGTPSAIILTSGTGLPLSTGITGTLPIANNCPGAAGASSTTFLRGDCSWQTPSGGGNVSTAGTPTANQVTVFAGATTIQGVGPGSVGQSLRSNGSGSPPSYQSGEWVLLNTLTASSSATLSDTTSLTSTYAEYEIVFEDMISATNAVSCELQVHAAGSYQTTGYNSAVLFGNGSTVVSTGPTTFIPCSVGSATSSSVALNTVIRVNNPSVVSVHPWNGTTNSFICSPTTCIGNVGGNWGTSATIDGFQILMSSGNITSGKVKIYGRL